MKRSALILILAFALFTGTQAQTMILAPTLLASAGGYGESDNLYISWTLGELAVSTLSGGNYMLTQGFQQSFGLDVSAREKMSDLSIRAYPNPVNNELMVRFDVEDSNDYLLEIEDVTGRIMYQQSHKGVVPGDILKINTSLYSQGVYFLRILKSDLSQMQVISIRKL